MYNVEFYEDAHGTEPVKDFLIDLQNRRDTDKSARILSEKILTYIRVLQEYGTRAGIPYIKHIEGDIWELRPHPERILFFSYVGNTFVLLHHFRKKTQKTPRKEIDCAKRRAQEYNERRDKHGE